MAKKSDDYRPGAYELIDIRMMNSDTTETVSLTRLCVYFNLYEDIYKNCMQADFHLVDGQGLFSDFPINGDEVIELAYKTASEDCELVNLLFRVYKIGPREPVTDKSVSYTLYAVSEEAVVDNTLRVHGVYKNKPINLIAKDVFDEYLKMASSGIDEGINITGKPGGSQLRVEAIDALTEITYPDGKAFSAEISKGNVKFIGNGMRPIEFINLLASEAEGLNSKSSTFLFYENADGYRFETIEQMGASNPVEEYIYVMKNRELSATQKSKFLEYQKIEQLTVQPLYDNFGKLMNGVFGSKVNYFDPLTKTYRVNRYNYATEFENERHMEQFKVANERFLSRYDVAESKGITLHSDIAQEFSQYIRSKTPGLSYRRKQNFLSKERSAKLNFESVKMHFSIPGDSTLRVGKTFTMNLPEASGTKDKLNKDDRYLRGNFIISSLRHHINLGAEEYTTYIEGIKDSFSETLTNNPPDFDEWG